MRIFLSYILLLIVTFSCGTIETIEAQRVKKSSSDPIEKQVQDNTSDIAKLESRQDNLKNKQRELQNDYDELKRIVDSLISPQQPIIITDIVKGAGKNVTGGRGGIVVKVTNLNDSGAGSLRSALMMKVPRMIVFDVSGTIILNSRIELIKENSNFTVLGQTAPMGGITISNNVIRVGGGWNRASEPCDNNIWMYVRPRNGRYNGQPDQEAANAIICSGANGLVFKNCSFSFCDDQAISAGGDWGDLRNITIQNCIFSENATGVILGMNSAKPTGDASIINNLFIDQSHRTPNMGGGLQYDVINNVYFNWKSRLSNINSNAPNVNFVGNYLIEGSYTDIGQYNQIQNKSPRIYNSDNYLERIRGVIGNNVLWQRFVDAGNVSSSIFVNEPFDYLGGLEPMSHNATYDYVAENAGANKYIKDNGDIGYYRDSYDTQKLSNLRNRISTNPFNKNWTLPTLPTNVRPSNYDVNNNGICDIWESENIPDGENWEDISPSGYSWLETFAYR